VSVKSEVFKPPVDTILRLDGRTQDVGDAVKVVRFVPQLGVKKGVKFVLEKEGGGGLF